MLAFSLVTSRGICLVRNVSVMRSPSRKFPVIDDLVNSGRGRGGGGKGLLAKNKNTAPQYKSRGLNQENYVQALDNPDVSILLGVGPAGTGKTLFACNSAVQQLNRGLVQKIIVTRPLVSVEEELGFLPGNLIRKMDPWTRPLFDILGEFYSQKDIDAMLHSGVIEISPLAFMRGRTFKRAFVIADEMQNSSPNQMMMLTTRLGDGSKMVITGDLKQSDRMENNGLADLMKRIDSSRVNMTMIQLVEFGVHDIQRSPVVSKIMELYDDSPKKSEVVVPKIKMIVTDERLKNINTTASSSDAALIPLDPLLKDKTRIVISKWFEANHGL